MSDAELDRFAERLMTNVRDQAIVDLDARVSEPARDPISRRWAKVIQGDQTRDTVRALIPEIVDHVLYQLLHAIDNEDLPLAWLNEDGSCTSLEELGLGEMAGWMMPPEGWRERFSSQRAPDPLGECRDEEGDADD